MHFQGADPNNRAQIVIGTYEAGGSNAPWCIRWWQGATFRFENLDFVLGALAVPAGGWSGWRSIVRNQYCDSVTVHLNNVDFTGEGDMSIVRPFGGAHVNIVARAVVLDGDVSLIGTATLSVTSIVTAAQLTLQNGAAIASGTPTLGENYLLGD